jgi:hypothetical protein
LVKQALTEQLALLVRKDLKEFKVQLVKQELQVQLAQLALLALLVRKDLKVFKAQQERME